MGGFVIGITGGTGTGKSALAGYLRRLGAAYYSVDAAAHALYERDSTVAARLARAFGPRVFGPDGQVNRRALGAIAFGSASALRRLDAAVHPALGREAAAAIGRMRSRHSVTAVEAGAILFELGLDRAVDLVVLARCGRATRIRRLIRGRGLARAEASRRLAVLRGVEERAVASARRCRRARVVDTNGIPARLAEAAAALMEEAHGAHAA